MAKKSKKRRSKSNGVVFGFLTFLFSLVGLGALLAFGIATYFIVTSFIEGNVYMVFFISLGLLFLLWIFGRITWKSVSRNMMGRF